MRRDVQEIFKATPHEKQVMMFSATLAKDVRPVCKKFMQDVSPIMMLRDINTMFTLGLLYHLYLKHITQCLARLSCLLLVMNDVESIKLPEKMSMMNVECE